MPLPEGFAIRPATTSDLDALVLHCRAMFSDMGYREEFALAAMSAKFKVWLLQRMEAGEYLAWLVIGPDDTVAAGAGLWLMDWPPHVVGRGPRRGNILNVYTSEKFRRRGLARELMLAALAWCRENDVDTIILHASDDGRGLYQSLGFAPTNEMRLEMQKDRRVT